MSVVEEYQQALRDLQDKIQAAEAIVAKIHEASNALRNWRQTTISNVSVGFTAGMSGNESTRRIDGSEFPTIEQLADALQAYHRAQREAISAYGKIPREKRIGLSPPPASH